MTEREDDTYDWLAGDLYAAVDEQERALVRLFEEERALAASDFGAWVAKAHAAVAPIHYQFGGKDVGRLIESREGIVVELEKKAGKL